MRTYASSGYSFWLIKNWRLGVLGSALTSGRLVHQMLCLRVLFCSWCTAEKIDLNRSFGSLLKIRNHSAIKHKIGRSRQRGTPGHQGLLIEWVLKLSPNSFALHRSAFSPRPWTAVGKKHKRNKTEKGFLSQMRLFCQKSCKICDFVLLF